MVVLLRFATNSPLVRLSPLAGRGQGEGLGARIAKADYVDESRSAWSMAGLRPKPLAPALSPFHGERELVPTIID
jgi:hypothetical protein